MRTAWRSAVLLAVSLALPESTWSTLGAGRQLTTGFLSYPTAVMTCRGRWANTGPSAAPRPAGVVMMAENDTASSERRSGRKPKKTSGGPKAHFASLKVRAVL